MSDIIGRASKPAVSPYAVKTPREPVDLDRLTAELSQLQGDPIERHQFTSTPVPGQGAPAEQRALTIHDLPHPPTDLKLSEHLNMLADGFLLVTFGEMMQLANELVKVKGTDKIENATDFARLLHAWAKERKNPTPQAENWTHEPLESSV